MGLSGALSPARFRWIAFTTFSIASFWPISFLPINPESFESLFFSDFTILLTGTLVIIETTSAILSSFTVTLLSLESSCQRSCASINDRSTRFSSSLSFAASSYFCFFTTVFFDSLTSSSCFSRSIISLGTLMFLIFTREPASSRASMALSGKKRSDI